MSNGHYVDRYNSQIQTQAIENLQFFSQEDNPTQVCLTKNSITAWDKPSFSNTLQKCKKRYRNYSAQNHHPIISRTNQQKNLFSPKSMRYLNINPIILDFELPMQSPDMHQSVKTMRNYQESRCQRFFYKTQKKVQIKKEKSQELCKVSKENKDSKQVKLLKLKILNNLEQQRNILKYPQQKDNINKKTNFRPLSSYSHLKKEELYKFPSSVVLNNNIDNNSNLAQNNALISRKQKLKKFNKKLKKKPKDIIAAIKQLTNNYIY